MYQPLDMNFNFSLCIVLQHVALCIPYKAPGGNPNLFACFLFVVECRKNQDL